MAGTVLLCAVLACGVARAGGRSGVPRLSPGERAAVHAYLTAQYEYVQAVSEAAPATVAAYEAQARAIAGECPGAFAGAPQPQRSVVVAASPAARPRARQRGEEQREQTQMIDLQGEIETSLVAAEHQPLLPARRALLAKLKTLTGKSMLAVLFKGDVSGIEEEEADQQAPAVCADITAWAASGYRSLSPASREIALREEANGITALEHAFEQLDSNKILSVLDPADRALSNKFAQTQAEIANTIANSLLVAHRGLEAALGLKPRESSVPKKSSSTIDVGTVKTAAGTRDTISIERTKGGSGCRAQVQIRQVESGGTGLLGRILGIFGVEGPLCLSDKTIGPPHAECSNGLIEIRARLLPAARRAVLRLSDGRSIASRPVLVPTRLGGPAAIYFQALRGPSPIPISLQELDAHGRVLRTSTLPRILECSTHPVKYVRGGKLTLVRGSAPQGPEFSIVGERYRYAGHLHTKLALGTGPRAPEPEPESESEQIPFGDLPRGSRAHELHELQGPLDYKSTSSCHPHEFAIVFGLLRHPRDAAFAEVAGKLVAMTPVHIPASLHMPGVLVYLASQGSAEEILVRSPSGQVQMRQDFRTQAIEQRETCEGESEGPGPAPGILDAVGNTTTLTIGG